jgi:hypothetical protein
MRLRDVLAPDPRFAVRRGRIFALSRRYRSRHRSASPRSMPLRGFTMFWIIGADGAAKALAEMLSGKGMIPSTADRRIVTRKPASVSSISSQSSGHQLGAAERAAAGKH